MLRNLVLDFGDDVTVRKKTRIGSIQKETVDKVKSFYCRGDITRNAPGRRDVVTVRDEAGKKTLQNRHLVMSIKECCATFKEFNPDVKIGVSKFAEIHPPNVLFSSETPSNVCQLIHLPSEFHTEILNFASTSHITFGNSQMTYSDSQNTCSCNNVMFN